MLKPGAFPEQHAGSAVSLVKERCRVRIPLPERYSPVAVKLGGMNTDNNLLYFSGIDIVFRENIQSAVDYVVVSLAGRIFFMATFYVELPAQVTVHVLGVMRFRVITVEKSLDAEKRVFEPGKAVLRHQRGYDAVPGSHRPVQLERHASVPSRAKT